MQMTICLFSTAAYTFILPTVSLLARPGEASTAAARAKRQSWNERGTSLFPLTPLHGKQISAGADSVLANGN